MPVSKYDLEDARGYYFAAGGLESDLGPRDDAGWYWRRAAKLWGDLAKRFESQRDRARANARILAHAYEHDTRPPQRVVAEARGYPAEDEQELP